MEITLDGLCVGEQATVTRIEVAPILRSKLRSFGFVSGTKVSCRYRSPGGKVTALEFRGTVVAVRTRNLKDIWGAAK